MLKFGLQTRLLPAFPVSLALSTPNKTGTGLEPTGRKEGRVQPVYDWKIPHESMSVSEAF